MYTDTKKVIEHIIEIESLEVIKNRERFFSLLMDLIPELNEERKILNRALTVESMELIYHAMSSGENITDNQVNYIIQYMIDELGLNEKWAYFTVKCFFDVKVLQDVNQNELFKSVSSEKINVQLNEKKSVYVTDTKIERKHSVKNEKIKRRRKWFSGIIACTVCVIIVGVVSAVWVVNKPQRDIDKTAKQMYATAQDYIESGDYESALATADTISSQWSRYKKVETLKIAAVKGQLNKSISQLESSSDYETVIKYINKYISDVSSDKEIELIYEDVVLKYKKSVIAKVDEYLKDKDFKEAVNMLTKATILVNSDAELEAKKIECSKAEISEQISIYKSQSNYKDIIKLVNDNLDIINNDEDIFLELRNSEVLYVKAVIADAASAYKIDGYEAAISVINDGLKLLPDDSDLVAEKESYEVCAPVDLTTLNFYSEYGDVGIFEGRKDTLGNYYKTGFETLHDNYYSYKVFDIGKQYNTFTAVGFVRNADKGYSTGVAKVKIYGDDKLLFSKTISSDMKPFEIEFDITGVVDLKIEMMGSFNGWDGMYAAIGNVMLQKVK